MKKKRYYWFAGDGCEVRVLSLWVLKWLLLTVLQSVHKIHCCIILASKLSDTVKPIAASSLSDSIVWRFATNCKEPNRDIHSRAKKECVHDWELSINVTPPKYTTTKSFGPSRKSQRGKVLERVLGDLFQIWFRKCNSCLLSAYLITMVTDPN
jgi:hypothetical protein